MTILIALAVWYIINGAFIAIMYTRKIGHLSSIHKLAWILAWPAMMIAEAVDVKPYAYHSILLFVWTLAIVCAGMMP